MKTALIGYTGFVGQTLDAMMKPESRYRSTDIGEILGREFEHVVCCGVQAKKWWANQHPEEDWAGIEALLDHLARVRAERFTLVSTIDVYHPPRGGDETMEISEEGHHAYGLNRLRAEEWIRRQFPRVLVLRLPGLFGPGLKKNVIFDMLHDNDLHKVNPNGVFQYYDTRRLAGDIAKAWDLGIELLNVTSGPLGTGEIRDRFFPGKVLGGEGEGEAPMVAPPGYDMRSKHAGHWGGEDGYLYSKEQVVEDLRDWLMGGSSRA